MRYTKSLSIYPEVSELIEKVKSADMDELHEISEKAMIGLEELHTVQCMLKDIVTQHEQGRKINAIIRTLQKEHTKQNDQLQILALKIRRRQRELNARKKGGEQ